MNQEEEFISIMMIPITIILILASPAIAFGILRIIIGG